MLATVRRVWQKRWVRLGVLAVGVLVAVGAVRVAFIVRGIYSPELDALPDSADAIVVFAGEEERFILARSLVDQGLAPIVVASHGDEVGGFRELCDLDHRYEVWCVRPPSDSTRGEAQLFGELAKEHGWESLIAVTGNYHVERARTYLSRCFDGQLDFAAVPWKRYNNRVVRHEVLGTIQALHLSRGC